jgi:hypothetical protein
MYCYVIIVCLLLASESESEIGIDGRQTQTQRQRQTGSGKKFYGVHGFITTPRFSLSSNQISRSNTNRCQNKQQQRQQQRIRQLGSEKSTRNIPIFTGQLAMVSQTSRDNNNNNNNNREHMHGRSEQPNTLAMASQHLWRTTIPSMAVSAVVTISVLLMACSVPAIAVAMASGDNVPSTTTTTTTTLSRSSIVIADGNNAMDVSDLVRSLRPATADRPQIPFPTNEVLQRAAEEAASSSASSSPSASASRKQQQQYPVPQENLLRENQYSLPALISLESAATRSRGSSLTNPNPLSDRPYNGADVLVLRVWNERPSGGDSLDETDAEATTAEATTIGGAKIPISAVVGGFPVRVSLGPQNAKMASDTAPRASTISAASQDARAINEWKEYLSSKSLWVSAAVCRERAQGDTVASPTTPPPSSSRSCPSDYPTPVLEGLGFSKWIDLSGMVKAASPERTTDGTTSNSNNSNEKPGGGLRAPVSLVLAAPR